MKHLFLLLSMLVFIMILSTNVFAGGGKVRGDNGEGLVAQEQLNIQYPDLF